jgi:aromatic ring-cleaving dioxygenase
MHRGYEKPKLVPHDNSDNDISEHAKFRLFLARQLALKKFREKYSQA